MWEPKKKKKKFIQLGKKKKKPIDAMTKAGGG